MPALARSDLGWLPENDPLLPIPLSCVLHLLVEVSRDEGPNAPSLIADDQSIFEIGLIGREGLHGVTLRDGFHRIANAMHYHSTHELFTVSNTPETLRVGQGWMAAISDDIVLHVVQQYLTALVDAMCRLVVGSSPCVSRVEMLPHPEVGFAHLKPWLGNRLHSSNNKLLNIEIANAIADRPIPTEIRARALPSGAEIWPSLRSGNSFAEDLETLVGSMLPYETPTLNGMARVLGTKGCYVL